ATDPTWSPDSQRIAFSLFGGIWQVNADGGVAEQLTTSPGYHAHPAWSPAGDKIAFVRGGAPAGRIPNVPGSLAVVDLATGRDRDVRTPYPLIGSLAWSPDGRKLVCALRMPNASAELHEIDMETGAATDIQTPLQWSRGAVIPWVDVAWNPKRHEIFFSAQRGPAPQIWSMTPAGPPIAIQMPL